MSDLSVHYIGQEITTRSGRMTSAIPNEPMGAGSLPHSGTNSTIAVQVGFEIDIKNNLRHCDIKTKIKFIGI